MSEKTDPDVDGFDDAWLALREGADDRARDVALERASIEALRGRDRDDGPIRVLDLGSGTGANFRRLAPRLGGDQRWTLVDHDAALLARLEDRLAPWCEAHGARLSTDGDVLTVRGGTFTAEVRRRETDLATALDALPFAGSDLVTGSALLDLAGAGWLDALASRCAGAGAVVLFVLSYDGRVRWTPAHADDGDVRVRFDRHQRRDKGLGVALGPDAATYFTDALRTRGLDVATATSDWTLDDADGALRHELADGIAAAVIELDPAFAERAAAWLDLRRGAADGTALIGHVDVLAVPAPARSDAKDPSGSDTSGLRADLPR